jgi:hypothetical protein
MDELREAVNISGSWSIDGQDGLPDDEEGQHGGKSVATVGEASERDSGRESGLRERG